MLARRARNYLALSAVALAGSIAGPAARGFGFITPDDGGRDLFVKSTAPANARGFMQFTPGTWNGVPERRPPAQ